MAARVFGAGPVDAVTVIDAPVSLSYARKARITFLAVAAVVAVSTAVVLAVFVHPVLAVLLGLQGWTPSALRPG